MYLHRIENDKRTGPYQYHTFRDIHGNLDRSRNGQDSHPVPDWSYDHIWKFAFKTKNQLRRWFSKSDRERLKELKFYYAVYRVKKIYTQQPDNRQILFKYRRAKRVGIYPLNW